VAHKPLTPLAEKHFPELSCGLPFGKRARTWRTPSTCSVFHFAGGEPHLCGGASGSPSSG
jgi:hypothetical protein